MHYELAKELKDAGFPQGEEGSSKQKLWHPDYVGKSSMPLELYVYVPTLSELIEACGKDFGALHSMVDSTGKGGISAWRAENGDDSSFLSGKELITGRGKTPEEAVARLWLAINR